MSKGSIYFGRMSHPCCTIEPTVSQIQLCMFHTFSSSCGSSSHGCGDSQSAFFFKERTPNNFSIHFENVFEKKKWKWSCFSHLIDFCQNVYRQRYQEESSWHREPYIRVEWFQKIVKFNIFFKGFHIQDAYSCKKKITFKSTSSTEIERKLCTQIHEWSRKVNHEFSIVGNGQISNRQISFLEKVSIKMETVLE